MAGELDGYDDDRSRLRISDADRHKVAELLREAAGEGRIDMDELDERLEAAYVAKTYGDLVPLTADLPLGSQPHSPVVPPHAGGPACLLSATTPPSRSWAGSVVRACGRWATRTRPSPSWAGSTSTCARHGSPAGRPSSTPMPSGPVSTSTSTSTPSSWSTASASWGPSTRVATRWHRSSDRTPRWSA